MALRDYQKDLYIRTAKAIRDGCKGILVRAECRSGKSYVMLEMIKHTNGECLVLAHRKELIKQHSELLKGIDNVRIESVFTEANHLGEHEKPKCIYIDEAHLSEAQSYKKVCSYYGCTVIGFTATPVRLDGHKLSLFDEIININITAQDLINAGNISKYDLYAPDIGIDANDLSVVRGDYQTKDLESLFSKATVYGDIVRYYQKLANGKQSIAYCVSVEHSKAVRDIFLANGISAVHMDGKTPKKTRDEIMESFKKGEFKILCNVGLISEGITVPDCECCLLLRPTQSLALYIQQSMRCLTPKENKKAIIIDYVGNFQRHGMPTEHREWSLNGAKKKKRINEDGSFAIRQCPDCYRVFKTANVCPYCGYEYEVKGRELKQMQDVELKKITEEEKKNIEIKKRDLRMEVGRARSKEELIRIARDRGYAMGWVFMQCRLKGIS